MTAKLQDMALVVTVTVTGSVDASNQMTISASFAKATCVPPAAAGAQIVDSQGDIDLTQMTMGIGFTTGTDIYFVLDGSVTGPTGTAFPVFFEHPASKAVTITTAAGTDPGINPSFPGKEKGTSVLLLDDLDKNKDRYSYTLHVLANVIAGKTATADIDPAIINRGDG